MKLTVDRLDHPQPTTSLSILSATMSTVVYVQNYGLTPVGMRYSVLLSDGTTASLPSASIPRLDELLPMADTALDTAAVKNAKSRQRLLWARANHPIIASKRPRLRSQAEDPHPDLTEEHYVLVCITAWKLASTYQGRLYQAQWENGEKTWERATFLDTLTGVDAGVLVAMADAPGDGPQTRADKAAQRRQYAAALPSGVNPTTRYTSGLCIACANTCPGLKCVDCSDHVCLHCLPAAGFTRCPAHGGEPLVLSHEVQLRGRPLHGELLYHLVSVDPTLAVRFPSPPTTSIATATAVFVAYHTRSDWNSAKHVLLICDALEGMTDKTTLVVVLTCWMNSAVQRMVMRAISYLHPTIRFVAYRIRHLVLSPSLIASAFTHASTTVRFTRYHAGLSEWCTAQTGAVLFERGQGPFQVALDARPRCQCGLAYPSRSTRAAENVRRRVCSLNGELCVELLVVDERTGEERDLVVVD